MTMQSVAKSVCQEIEEVLAEYRYRVMLRTMQTETEQTNITVPTKIQ